MAVLRSKREVAGTEYENTFSKLYELSKTHTSSVSKRRKKWLCADIDEAMNRAYINIMAIDTMRIQKEPPDSERVVNLSSNAIDSLVSLQKPLLCMWNICRFETRKMVTWAAAINDELKLLRNMARREGEREVIMILDWQAIKSMKFLENMSNLHYYTHGKVTNAPMAYDSTQGKLLIECVNDALYYVSRANFRIPQTKKEYETRREYISLAISSLKQMNRGILSYFNLMKYSERIMEEWSTMLSEEIKLLVGLQKSDKARFSNLE